MDAMRQFTRQGGADTYGLTGIYALRLEDARGAVVSVELGTVWLTEARNPDDICLRAGESYRLRQDGAAVLMALRSSPLAIVHVERPTSAAL